jgi:hypothetical protein
MVVPRRRTPLVLLALMVQKAGQVLQWGRDGWDFALVELIEILIVGVKPDICEACSWIQGSLPGGILQLHPEYKKAIFMLLQHIQPPMLLLSLCQS